MCISVPSGYQMNSAGEIRYVGPRFYEHPVAAQPSLPISIDVHIHCAHPEPALFTASCDEALAE